MFRPDRLILRESYPLAGWVVVIHLLAVVAAQVSGLPLVLKLLLLALIAWQAVYLLRRYVFLIHPDSIREIRWTELSWFVRLAEGTELEVRPAPGCRLYGWIALLRFQIITPAMGRKSFLNAWLLSGPQSTQAIRRLRVQLIQTCSNRN